MGWHAIYAERNRELFARDNLLARGIEAFCPFEVVTRRIKARGQNLYRVETRNEPLFTNYLFAETEDYATVRETRGVIEVVKSGGVPLRMPARVIERLRAIAGPDGCFVKRDTTKPSFHFKAFVGDFVEFTKDSPLHGLIGRVASVGKLDATGEITAWVNMFGGERQVDVSYKLVGPIVDPSIAASVAA